MCLSLKTQQKKSPRNRKHTNQGAIVDNPCPVLHFLLGGLLCGKPPQNPAFSVRSLLTMTAYNDFSLWKRHKAQTFACIWIAYLLGFHSIQQSWPVDPSCSPVVFLCPRSHLKVVIFKLFQKN